MEVKKRGRKPKIIDENNEPKKRGRKPKYLKNEEEQNIIEEKKVHKKRGRKPKDSIYCVKQIDKIIIPENESDNVILHLPIHSDDLIEENNITEYNPEINIPEPYEKENNNYELLSLKNDENKIIKNQNDEEKDEIEYNNEDENVMNIIKKKCTNNINNICEKKLKLIQYEFLDANSRKCWPTNTHIYCMWCCHKFDGIPISIPQKYYNEKFYVYGNFCSFNCASSYIFNKNDDFMWKHYNLLNLLYKKISNNQNKKIKLAPPKEVLKIFGGYLTIEEYRNELLTGNKEFKVIEPPLISVVPKIEETLFKQEDSLLNNNKLYVPLNGDLVDKARTSMKLKRNKPVIQEKSTLHSFMDLKIV